MDCGVAAQKCPGGRNPTGADLFDYLPFTQAENRPHLSAEGALHYAVISVISPFCIPHWEIQSFVICFVGKVSFKQK